MTTKTQPNTRPSAFRLLVMMFFMGGLTSCGIATTRASLPPAGGEAGKTVESIEQESRLNIEKQRARERAKFVAFCSNKTKTLVLAESANSGKAVAQRRLADCLLSDNKPAEAISWYELSARQGSVKARFALALLFETGITRNSQELLPKDLEKALELYRQAAELGYPPAQYNLGVLLSRGVLGEKDQPQAAQWYEKAAISGLADAAYNLATLYHEGDGMDRDLEAAFKWYRAAALGNNSHGMYRLALSYDTGIGVEINAEEAYRWYLKAAIRDNTEAQFRLAAMYIKGNGIEKSDTEAKRWLIKAASLGHPKSVAFLCTLEGHGANSDCDSNTYLAAVN